jgi:hypothetical protein
MTDKNIVATLSAELEYWLQLPSKEVLQAKLYKAIEEVALRFGVGDE